jgi:hypothetical protein
MEEEKRAIRAMPFVTTLSFVRAVKGKTEGWRVTLTETLAQKVTDDPNVIQTRILQQARFRAKTAQARAKAVRDQTKVVKKVVLETEKDNDTAQKAVQELLRVWVLKGLFCQWMMTLNSGHDVSE